MKKIAAIVRKTHFEDVKQALFEAPCITLVKGCTHNTLGCTQVAEVGLSETKSVELLPFSLPTNHCRYVVNVEHLVEIQGG